MRGVQANANHTVHAVAGAQRPETALKWRLPAKKRPNSSVRAAGSVLSYRTLSSAWKAPRSIWSIADLMALIGVSCFDHPVVTELNRIICGGVTVGFDLALTLAAKLRVEGAA